MSHDVSVWRHLMEISSDERKKIPLTDFIFTAELKTPGENFPRVVSTCRCSPRPRQRTDSLSHVCRGIVTLFSLSENRCVCVCVSVCVRPRSSDCVLHTPGSPQSFVNTVGETHPPHSEPPRSALLIWRLHAHRSDTRTSRRRADPNAS